MCDLTGAMKSKAVRGHLVFNCHSSNDLKILLIARENEDTGKWERSYPAESSRTGAARQEQNSPMRRICPNSKGTDNWPSRGWFIDCLIKLSAAKFIYTPLRFGPLEIPNFISGIVSAPQMREGGAKPMPRKPREGAGEPARFWP